MKTNVYIIIIKFYRSTFCTVVKISAPLTVYDRTRKTELIIIIESRIVTQSYKERSGREFLHHESNYGFNGKRNNLGVIHELNLIHYQCIYTYSCR